MATQSKTNGACFSHERDLREEFASLTEKTESFRTKLFQLTNTAVSEFIERCEGDMTTLSEEAQAKEDRISKEVEECLAMRSQIDKKSAEVEEVKTSISIRAKETDALLQEREKLETDVERKQKEMEKEGELLAAQSSSEEKEHLQSALTLFMDRLGLQFKKISGCRLQVVMTCIDSKDPDRPFVFCVKIEHHSYTVSDVEPSVINLQQLVSSLNATNDFQQFVRGMRRAFRESL